MTEDKILIRVRALLAQANHPNTGDAEREAFLAKVDELMVKHAIDEALLAATQTEAQRQTPVTETVPMWDKGVNGQRFRTILLEICRTCRVRAVPVKSRVNDPEDQQMVTMVGFRSDVDYAQLLFTTIQFAFIAKIRPSWDPNLEIGANIYNFKVAGFDWEHIYRVAQENGVACIYRHIPGASGTLWNTYDSYVKRNNLTRIKTNRFGAYRESFAEAFVSRMCSRLEEMRMRGKEQVRTSGAELVLVGREEEVDEEFYRRFPHRRPLTAEELRLQNERDLEEARLEKEKHAAWLASLSDRERAAYEKKEQKRRQEEAKRSDRYWREYDKQAAARYDSAGMRAGAAAAESVNLNRPGPAAGASNRKAL
jgi:hypothetical protein